MTRRVTGNLPTEVTSFVGRRRELAKSRALLSSARLVTMTGAGGVGKTRLALRLAESAHRAFADGVWFVALADLQDGELMVQTISTTLGLRDETTDPLRRLTDHLADKRLLLVMDNCEHLVQSCASLIATVLSAAPGVRVLATSRQVLGVGGEQVLPVPALPVPNARDGAPGTDAVTLLTERATAANPDFQLTDGNRTTIEAICRRLDGIPLALELAALRFRVLTPDQVLDRLDDSLHLLTTGPRTSPRRQQTLDAAIRWSYDLCSPAEQRLWQQLAVFSGGFDLEAVEAVCADADAITVDVLSGLVDKSVVTLGQDPPERYRMLETLRQFGLARLAGTGVEQRVRRRHRDHYRLIAQRGTTDYYGPDDVAWFRQTRREHANLRAALSFSLAGPDGDTGIALEIATGLRPFWEHAGFLLEGYRWFDRAFAADPAPSRVRARALSASGLLALLLSEEESAARMASECAALARSLDAKDLLGETTVHSALLAFVRSDLPRALSLAELAAQRCAAAGNRGVAAESLAFAAMCAFSLRHPRAGALARSFLELADELGSHLLRGLALWLVGLDNWRAGDQPGAREYLSQAIELFTLFDRSVLVASGFDGLAWSAAASGEAERAARLMGAASAVREGSTMRLAHAMTEIVGNTVGRQVRETLGDEAFATVFGEGAALALPDALGYALGREQPPMAGVAEEDRALRVLTRREWDVARLVAAGLTNRRIAEELIISVRTAEAHIDHILTKLGFRSRTQIATWLAEAGRQE